MALVVQTTHWTLTLPFLVCTVFDVLSPQLDYRLQPTNQARRTSYYHFIYIFHSVMFDRYLFNIGSSLSHRKAFCSEITILGMSHDSVLWSKNLYISVSLTGVGGQGFISLLEVLSLVGTVFLQNKHGQSIPNLPNPVGVLQHSKILYYLREMLIYHYHHHFGSL